MVLNRSKLSRIPYLDRHPVSATVSSNCSHRLAEKENSLSAATHFSDLLRATHITKTSIKAKEIPLKRPGKTLL